MLGFSPGIFLGNRQQLWGVQRNAPGLKPDFLMQLITGLKAGAPTQLARVSTNSPR